MEPAEHVVIPLLLQGQKQGQWKGTGAGLWVGLQKDTADALGELAVMSQV